MAEFPLPVLQIWRSRKRVAIQILLMNIHVSEWKYYCLHLVPKFGDMWDRQNWRLHLTVEFTRAPSKLWKVPALKYNYQFSYFEKSVGPSGKISVIHWYIRSLATQGTRLRHFKNTPCSSSASSVNKLLINKLDRQDKPTMTFPWNFKVNRTVDSKRSLSNAIIKSPSLSSDQVHLWARSVHK